MQQVNFSELNELKKKEFFKYLMNNNIQFQEGQSNYYAKVVLKPTNLPAAKSVSSKSVSKSKEKIKYKQTQKQTKKTFKLTHLNRQKQNKQPLFNSKQKQYNNRRPILHKLQTPRKSQASLKNHKKNQLSLSDYSNENHLNLSDIGTTRKPLKSHTQRHKRNHTDNNKYHKSNTCQKNKQRQIPKQKIFVPKFGTTYRQISNEKKPYDNTQRFEQRLSCYLKIFKIGTIFSRTSKWPRHQLDKHIEQLYSVCFIKNNNLLKSKKVKQTIQKKFVFASFIYCNYQQKYKSKKSIQFNIASLSYSLIHHLDIERSRNLVLFNKFLVQEYSYEDLIFFLYLRNLAEKQLKQSYDRGQRKIKPQDEDFKYSINQKQVVQLLKSLVGKDRDLLSQYTKLVQQYIYQGNINIYLLLEVLLQNYCIKRQTSQNVSERKSHPSTANTTTYFRQKSNILPNYIEVGFKQQIDSDSEQLTFGDSTFANKQKNEDTFWYETNKQVHLPTDSLEILIVSKMNKMISDLIKHILDDDQQFKLTISQFHGLIFNKAQNLIKSILEMDKLRWFKMLGIRHPQSNNLCHIENLQKNLRALRNQVDEGLLNKFCKRILTTPEFLQAIKKIVID